MKTKRLTKKNIKIQRTQPSLQTFAYNEGCTKHKCLEMYLYLTAVLLFIVDIYL